MTKTLNAVAEPEGPKPDKFAQTVEDALVAFREHEMYIVDMINRARAILHKRAVGAVRRELRQAEKDARAQCAEAETFHCYNESPCGVGACKFAKDDLVFLEVPTPRNADRKKERPQPSEHGPYSLEESVQPLYEIRKSEQ